MPGRGVSAQRGVYTSPTLWTDTCENITFLQLLLRTVAIGFAQTSNDWRPSSRLENL